MTLTECGGPSFATELNRSKAISRWDVSGSYLGCTWNAFTLNSAPLSHAFDEPSRIVRYDTVVFLEEKGRLFLVRWGFDSFGIFYRYSHDALGRGQNPHGVDDGTNAKRRSLVLDDGFVRNDTTSTRTCAGKHSVRTSTELLNCVISQVSYRLTLLSVMSRPPGGHESPFRTPKHSKRIVKIRNAHTSLAPLQVLN